MHAVTDGFKKSDNLHYDTLCGWVDRFIDQSSVQVFFNGNILSDPAYHIEDSRISTKMQPL